MAKHDKESDCWIIMGLAGEEPSVYDITKYLDDHPGGAEVLLDAAGIDATDQFEDIGHSNDARDTLKKYKIGLLKLSEAEKTAMAEEKVTRAGAAKGGGGMGMIVVIGIVVAIIAAYFAMQQ